MRLLLDESLSERLLKPLSELFPGCGHVRLLKGSGLTDAAIWHLAGAEEFLLTTRDEDFLSMSVLGGPPPKVVWLNVGNSRNAVIAALVQSHAADIERFVAHEEQAFLAIGFYKASSPPH